MKFTKITNIMLWVILAVSLFLVISMLSSLSPNEDDASMNTWLTANLYWAYFLLGLSVVAALSLEFVNTISDKKAAKSALVGLGALGAVVLISYLFSDNEIPTFYGAQKFVEDGTLTPSVSLWIGTGLIATYILSALAIGAIVWSSISRIFK
jgi:cation transport ATPase